MLQYLFKRKKSLPSSSFFKSGAGFTLVELLAVIAIISLLVSIILVNMGESRKRARDAAIITSLMEIRNAAELLYNNTISYEGVCDPGNTTLSSEGDFGRIKNYIEKQNGIISCKDSDTAYAVISSLNAADCWCIDSLGVSKEISLAPNETCSDKLLTTVCP